MEKAFVYLFQYTREKERFNRFYACPPRTHHKIDIWKFQIQVDAFVHDNRHDTLENVAESVEREILEKKGFVRLNGIKAILKSYKGIIANRLQIEVSEPSLSRI